MSIVVGTRHRSLRYPLDVATADGRRFLVNNVVEDTASQPITVVLNWTAQLKK